MHSVKAASKNRGVGLDRFLAVHRRPEGRARAGDHHRRRLPLLRDGATEVHPRRHAGPRAVHAQHGDRRLDGRRRDPARRRAPGRQRAVAAPRADRAAARHPDFVLAINKMDLVDFDRDVFESIRDEFEEILQRRALPRDSDQRAAGRQRHHHERAHAVVRGPQPARLPRDRQVTRNLPALPFRFPVQLVVRPNDEFRGYAGQIASGTVRVGDTVHAWPSGRTARVKRIVTYDGDLDMAFAPMSVTLTLDDEIDISRGDMLDNRAADGGTAVRGRDGLDGRAAARPGARLPAEAARRRPSPPRSTTGSC